MARKRPHEAGSTLLETLLVIGIFSLGLALALIYMDIPSLFSLLSDTKKKADMDMLYKGLSRMYVVEKRVPSKTQWGTFSCGKDAPEILSPYISRFPCDPSTGVRYSYIPLDAGCRECKTEKCQAFRLYTTLLNKNDKSITSSGCNSEGCGLVTDDGTVPNYTLSLSCGL